jgi:hypothetical protein
VLRRENVTPGVAAKFYKALVQAVLFYHSKTWNLIKAVLAWLDGSMFKLPTTWHRFIGQGGWLGTDGYAQRHLMSCRNVEGPQYSITYRNVGLR